jgi:hypothetical protein
MSLSAFEIDSIRQAVITYAPGASVLLFGSRTDDKKRGGNIDLLIIQQFKLEPRTIQQISEAIQRAIGEQKIDILAAIPGSEDPFVQYVLPGAIELK